MSTGKFCLFVSVLVGLGFYLWGCKNPPELPPASGGSDIFLAPDTQSTEGLVPRDSTLAGLLEAEGMPQGVIYEFIEVVRPVFDPRRLRAGQSYRLVRSLDGLLREFHYRVDNDQFLRVSGLDSDTYNFEAELVLYKKERGLVALRGVIDAERSSLVAAINEAGENVLLAMDLAEVFSAEIDFNSGIRRGDEFQVLYETVYREGEFVGYGPVFAAEFVNEGRRFHAFRFQVPGESPGYYDEQGKSLKRFFLRSPLQFNPQISSGFSRRRLHPVLRTYRPHWGVDYRAPTGSPVVTVANGVVVSAGMSGGSGRMVRIKHANGYETYYLHLSSIAKGIRRGTRVTQGSLIGRVGSTGLATGPHLDYRIRKNGSWVNPVTEHRNMPPGEPIPTPYLGAFETARDLALSRLFDSTSLHSAISRDFLTKRPTG